MMINLIIIVLLVISSGLFSGLTLGLMGLNVFDLKRKVKLGNKNAEKIYPLRKQGNLLLCTLLLGNVAVNSILAIFLGSITTGLFASFLATGLIVIFGEILPQSIFSRYALKFGAKMAWLVHIFIFIFYPLTKPLALALDLFLGGELPTVFSKREFRVFLDEQKQHKRSELTEKEFEIIKGGLVFSDKKVDSVMTPRVNTFMLKDDTILDRNHMHEIQKAGHSRIPIYKETTDKIVGLLYVKDLIQVEPSERKVVKDIMRKKVLYISDNSRLDRVLDSFKKNRIHIFIVQDKFKGMAGIITLEDVLEEIVGEIIDEFDKIVDMRDLSKKVEETNYK